LSVVFLFSLSPSLLPPKSSSPSSSSSSPPPSTLLSSSFAPIATISFEHRSFTSYGPNPDWQKAKLRAQEKAKAAAKKNKTTNKAKDKKAASTDNHDDNGDDHDDDEGFPLSEGGSVALGDAGGGGGDEGDGGDYGQVFEFGVSDLSHGCLVVLLFDEYAVINSDRCVVQSYDDG
jgi:hypothetical protein